MKTIKTKSFLVCMCLIYGSGYQASLAQNLVINGSFEQQGFNIPPAYRYFSNGDTVMPGWTVNIDGEGEPSYWFHKSGYTHVDDGMYAVSLNDGDSISTVVSLIAGHVYKLTFFGGGRADRPGLVEIAGSTYTFGDSTWCEITFISSRTSVELLRFVNPEDHEMFGNFPLDTVSLVEINCVSPFIVQQPIGSQVTIGQTVNMLLVAGGTTTLSYQWRKNGVNLIDDERISGVTSAELTINSAVYDDAGRYDVLVTNACGSIISDIIALVVTSSFPCNSTIHQEDFEDSFAQSVVITWGNWTIGAPGLLGSSLGFKESSPGGDQGLGDQSAFFLEGIPSDNSRIRVAFRLEGIANGDFGVYLNSHITQNPFVVEQGYEITVNPKDGDNPDAWITKYDGQTSRIASRPNIINRFELHELCIDRVADNIIVYLDGNEFMRVIDGAVHGGMIGFRAASRCTLDDIIVESGNNDMMDSNSDQHVDAIDFDAFSHCYNGPINLVGVECFCMDSNGDQYVDAIDFDAFSACYNGPTNPPGCY